MGLADPLGLAGSTRSRSGHGGSAPFARGGSASGCRCSRGSTCSWLRRLRIRRRRGGRRQPRREEASRHGGDVSFGSFLRVGGYGGGGPLGAAGPRSVSEPTCELPLPAEPPALEGGGGEDELVSWAVSLVVAALELRAIGAGATLFWSGAGGGCERLVVGGTNCVAVVWELVVRTVISTGFGFATAAAAVVAVVRPASTAGRVRARWTCPARTCRCGCFGGELAFTT